MSFSIIQIVLIALWSFFVAMDQFNLTESCNQPIINCSVVGLILGDFPTGLLVGGMYQLMTIGNMPIGGSSPPNILIGGIMGTVFAISSGLDTSAALGLAIPFAVIGQYANAALETFLYLAMPFADKYAENVNPKGIARLNWLTLSFQGMIYMLICLIGVIGGAALGGMLGNFAEKFAWIMNGLSVAGGMMRFVGFGVLLRIMLSNEYWGIYFAGFALANIIGFIPGLEGSALILIAMFGIALALYDYQTRTAMKVDDGNNIAGGEEDGI